MAERYLVAVVAAAVLDDDDGAAVLDADSLGDLTAEVHEESLDWNAPEGPT